MQDPCLVSGLSQPGGKLIDDQLDVERDDDPCDEPCQPLQPGTDAERAHAALVRYRMDQGKNGKGQLQREHDLAEDEHRTGSVLPIVRDDHHRRDDGQQARGQATQPRADAQVQVALHDDLSCQRTGDGGALPRGQQGDGKEDRCDCGAQQRL